MYLTFILLRSSQNVYRIYVFPAPINSEICYACQCYQCTKSADYDKAIDAILPNIFQPQDAVAVLGKDYQGPVSTPDVISYMHETPSAMRKEFYLVKTLSCEKQNIANSISTGAQSQGAILRISNIRFFLKQA